MKLFLSPRIHSNVPVQGPKDPEKERRARRALEDAGLDALLVRLPENVLYFTNYWPVTGWGLALVWRDDPPQLFYPESELDFTKRCLIDDPVPYAPSGTGPLLKALKGAGADLSGKRVGVELNHEGVACTHLCYELAVPSPRFFDALRSDHGGVSLVDATDLILELRRFKTPFDVRQYEMTQRLNARGLEAAAEAVEEEITEVALASTCEKAIMDATAEFGDEVTCARALAFVMGGPNGVHASRPFNVSSGYRMKRGEFAMLELNTQVNGYWSDLTRTWVVGRSPTEEQLEQARVVNEAIEAALAATRPGAPCEEAYDASRRRVEEAGLERWHAPFLGHGIGVKLHEPKPAILPGTKDAFRVGDYFSVEPGLYFEEVGALRFERDVVLEAGGPRCLDSFPCSL
ncbi:MAG: Xaa-Pro peptidase family protein [Promethearchaeota archaeon]